MTRRAIARRWVVARLVAVGTAGALTALDGQPRVAAMLLLAQVAGMLLARLVATDATASLILEVLLTAAALSVATASYSPFFAAVSLIPLWMLRRRSRRAASATACGYLALIWFAHVTQPSTGDARAIAVLSVAAVMVILLSGAAVSGADEPASTYALVSRVRELQGDDLDPLGIATRFLERLSTVTGATRLLLESVDGQLLGRIGPEGETKWAAPAPMVINDRIVAILHMDRDLPQTPEAAELIAEEMTRLGTALAFADIRSMASDAERSRLSREMHDGIAQEIASIGYAIDDLLSEAPEPFRPPLRELRRQLTGVVSDLRLSIFELRGRDHGTGLGSALSEMIKRVQPAVPFAIQLRLDESNTRFPRNVEDELLRIAQEALLNAKKHSQAKQVWVSARLHPPVAELTIEDDGIGLTPGRHDSFGLEVMRERATQINASLTVRDRHGGGTVVYLLLNPGSVGSPGHDG